MPEHGTDNDAFMLKVYYPSDLQPQETEILRFEDRETGDCTVQPHLDYPHAYLAELPSKLTATGVGRGYRADEAAEQTPRRGRSAAARTVVRARRKEADACRDRYSAPPVHAVLRL